MSNRTHLVLVFLLIGAVGGCAALKQPGRTAVAAEARQTASAAPVGAESETASDEKTEKKSEAKTKAEKEAKRAKLTRDLEIAREKIAQAQLAMDHQRADDEDAVRKAAAERDLAAAKVGDFEKHSAPVRVEKAQLSLKRAQDNLIEAEEELEQLEMMYGEQELAEKTSEIVIARAKRRIERARWHLNIQRQELHNLENETIPLERRELVLKVEAGEIQHQSKLRSAETNMLEKQIALMSAHAEVARLEIELKNLDVE